MTRKYVSKPKEWSHLAIQSYVSDSQVDVTDIMFVVFFLYFETYVSNNEYIV